MKNLKLTALAVLFSTGLFAQNFYLTADVGYAFGMNSQLGWMSNTESSSTINYQDGTNSTYSETNENVPFSLGKGLNFGASIGYMFNDHIGVDLGVNYLLGGKTEYTSYHKETEILTDGSTIVSESNSKSTAYSKMWNVIPAIIITPGFEKFNPYAKLGVVLSFGSFYMEDEYESSSNSPNGPSPYSSFQKNTFNGGMAFGFNGALGATYTLSEKLSLFGEVNFMGVSYAPTKVKLTESTNNGIDNLPNMSTYDKETEFVNEITRDSSVPNYEEPSKSLKFSFPMSSLGFNLGVKFSL